MIRSAELDRDADAWLTFVKLGTKGIRQKSNFTINFSKKCNCATAINVNIAFGNQMVAI